MAKTYRVNEVFYSLQGEGVRAGTPNVFIRFTGCNMRCEMKEGPKSPGGFDCDTEFESGRAVTLDELQNWLVQSVRIVSPKPETDAVKWIILTGGEPGLQVDAELVDYFHRFGFKLAIETNGSINLPKREKCDGSGELLEVIDWITLSPKVAEHAVKQLWANELKYVRGWGQAVPKPAATAEHYLISPAFDAMNVHEETLKWCTRLCLENPPWRLSLQTHKLLKVR